MVLYEARLQPTYTIGASRTIPPVPTSDLAPSLARGGGWTYLESADGTYNWNTVDGTIAVARQDAVRDFIFTFDSVPQWASTNPADPCDGNLPGACDAPDMRAFDDCVTRVVQRNCGVVQYFETWNDPNLKAFWNGTYTQLVKIAGDLYQIAKDPANCGCTNGVCSPGGGANPNQVLLPSITSILGQV